MPRVVKTVKNTEGHDVEVYSDECSICKGEMIYPKQKADEIEDMFPFVKKRVEQGTPCFNCALEQEQKHKVRFLSDDEIKMIEETLKNQKDD